MEDSTRPLNLEADLLVIGWGKAGKTLARDLAPIAPDLSAATVSRYVDLLARIFVVEWQQPWAPKLRSRARLRTSPKLHLADPALADGLRRAGWEVEQVAAYTTVTADARTLPPDLDGAWAAGGVDAVVLTAPSTTRAVLELLGPPPQGTGLVAIGATTAAATRKLGLTVAAVAPSPTPEGVLQATIDVTTSDPTLSTTPPLRSTS